MVSISLITRIRTAAIRRGPFTLPSGEVLDEYFDQYLLAADPLLLRDVADAMAHEFPRDTESVVGVALGGVPLAVALSAATGACAAFYRPEPKRYGTYHQIEAGTITGSKVVVVDDVVRTGSQVLRAAQTLRQAGAEVSSVLCILDRDLGGRDRLADNGIELRSLLTPSVLDNAAPRRSAR
ncbi:orotate phosphoribosyltransferase [Nocardia terpenica]|uniref:Orotate phosphoribosyltransferase n=1 Tax=Nocardia terpenica TaxID=455432 RepID=A0A161Z9J1_9NOCA|nr:orotate phosphoribosyltransferase [Nocardia terpenica]KZM75762.1 hypothetical protein AWN90_20720 [Nocardia terpenica]NQE86279.1 orotate phosphoribosyltransferase [Nocardia terpenica]